MNLLLGALQNLWNNFYNTCVLWRVPKAKTKACL